jgi:ketosteroid isomerase-like protein
MRAPVLMKNILTFLLGLAVVGAQTPQAIVDELLAADRAFAAAATRTTVVPALTAMFADDIVMSTPVPKPGFARGKTRATEALKTNPVNAGSRLEWSPLRGGVSADGRHGFTVGYMTLTDPDGKAQPLKYVAYWVKQREGWRVAAYRRTLADQPPSAWEMLAPAVPHALVAPTTDATILTRHKTSLEAAEKAFSDEAQTLGLGPAFAKYGSTDAVNVGPRSAAHFVVSAAEIARSVGAGSEGKPSPVSWAADEGSIVASSGDLGVTFGYIRSNTPPPAGQPGAVPFFTIWRRASPESPWRYVAE